MRWAGGLGMARDSPLGKAPMSTVGDSGLWVEARSRAGESWKSVPAEFCRPTVGRLCRKLHAGGLKEAKKWSVNF